MKKIYLKIFSILFVGSISISSYAQGTWKTTGTEGTIAPSTAITTGITGLTCMHSDILNITGKTDVATTVTYNGIAWDNQSFVQGGTNAMYYAFRPTSNGRLDIPVKMGSGKKTFILELTDACPDNASLAALTTNLATGDLIYGTPAYFTLPQVYDTYNNTTGTWDGSVAIQSTGGNVYMVMSFPVVANKTYVVGVAGSKLMLRGANYTLTSGLKGVSKNEAQVNVLNNSVNITTKGAGVVEIVDIRGALITKKSIADESNLTLSKSGVYFVKVKAQGQVTIKKIVIQ